MKTKITLYLFIMLLIIPNIHALGSVWTGTISPSTIDLCGQYPTNTTISASHIYNAEGVALNGVTATLIVPSNPAVRILSSPTVFLGNIDPFIEATTNPSWVVTCHPRYAGEYKVYINYTSVNGYTGSSMGETEALVRVHSEYDANAPTFINYTYFVTSLTTKADVAVTVNTGETATCKYTTNKGTTYDNINTTFSTTGGTSHKQILSGLNDGKYSYSVKCKDVSNNKNLDDYEISFVVDLPPTAQVILSRSSPLKAGLLNITLNVSEKLKTTPTVSYLLDSSKRVNVALTGADNLWTGYTYISEGDNNKIGIFEFSGVDLSNNVGNLVTSPNLFIIDTVGPSPPEDFIGNLTTANNSKGISLNWRGSEDTTKYNLYRSIASDASYLLYQRNLENASFIDKELSEGKSYDYVLTGIDAAGNEGKQSKELRIAFITNATNSTLNVTVTNTNITAVNLTIKENTEESNKKILINKISINFDAATDLINTLSTTRAEIQRSDKIIFELLGFESLIKAKKGELVNLQENLKDLKTKDAEYEVLKKEFEDISKNIEDLKKEVPSKIRTEETKKSEGKLADREKILASLNDLLESENKNQPKKAKENYALEVEEFQKNVKVTTEAKIIAITYLDGSTKKVTLVSKELLTEEVENAKVIEVISKKIIDDASNIYLDKQLRIIKADPVIGMDVKNVDKVTFKYVINKEIALDDLKETDAIILKGYDEFTGKIQSANILTGFVTKNLGRSLDVYNLFLILGVGIILVLTIVYLGSLKKGKRGNIKSNHREHQVSTGHPGFDVPHNNLRHQENQSNFKEQRNMYYAETIHHPRGETNALKLENSAGIHQLLNNAESHLIRKEFNQAAAVYPKVREQYHQLKNQGTMDHQTARRVARLYNNLSLLRNLSHARQCIQTGDIAKLKEVLTHNARIYNELKKEPNNQEFMSFIRAEHESYVRRL